MVLKATELRFCALLKVFNWKKKKKKLQHCHRIRKFLNPSLFLLNFYYLLDSFWADSSARICGVIVSFSSGGWSEIVTLFFFFFFVLQLTACAHGATALLFPMYWQHIFIPVLPPHLLDYCWYVWPPVYTLSFSIHFLIHTHLTHTDTDTDTHTHTHHAMCFCHALTLKLRCRCTCSHLLSLFRWAAPTIASPVWPLRYNERPGSPCSIFHAGANAALSSFKPSQGFVSTHLMQIQQIWGYVRETGAEVEAARQIYTRAGPFQICSRENRMKADSANAKQEMFQHRLFWSSVSCRSCKPVHHWQENVIFNTRLCFILFNHHTVLRALIRWSGHMICACTCAAVQLLNIILVYAWEEGGTPAETQRCRPAVCL